MEKIMISISIIINDLSNIQVKKGNFAKIYITMETEIYIEYKMIFSDIPLAISDYLKNIDRQNLVCFALRLIYSDGKYSDFKDYCSKFFCAENLNFMNDCYKHLYEYIQESDNIISHIIPHKYIIISQSTALELLRQIFSIDKNEFVVNVPKDLQEQYLFKALLLINQIIGYWEVPTELNSQGETTNLCLAKSIVCTTLNSFESSNIRPEYVAMLQIIKASISQLLQRFITISKSSQRIFNEKGFTIWQQYLYEAINLILYPLKNKKGGFPVILLNEQKDGETFLHNISFNEDTIVSLDENLDYMYFKAHPLIEMKDGSYLPISPIFCINRLYRSVYFEFRAINRTFIGTSKYLNDKSLLPILTTEFSEQILFDNYIRNTLSRHHGVKLSDNDCKQIKTIGREPDFYFRDGNNIILFENKDIKIADKVISSKKYDLLDAELQKKLINKHGVEQLIYNIKRINDKAFIWDSQIPNNPRIYPVLVIDDNSLCVPGLNYILNEAFQKQIKDYNIRIKVYPLILVELDTLIAFKNYFQSDSVRFKKILDKYYDYITTNKKIRASNKYFENISRFILLWQKKS